MPLIKTVVMMLALTSVGFTSQLKADSSCSGLTASGNAEYPPYLWRSPKDPRQLVGAIRYLIDDLAKETSTKISLIYSGPWGRVQQETAAGRVDMIAGAFFTQPRTLYMDYLYPAFQKTQTSVWFNTEHPIAYSEWSDLKSLQGMTVINNSFGQEFDEYAKSDLNISYVASLEQALRMLNAQRVDYLVYEENPAKAYAKQLDINNIETSTTPITEQALFLTMSQKSACNNQAFKHKLEQTLIQFAEEGRMEQYLERALNDWAMQTPK
ncbi:polar amino acid transport system substrate-binding protein [Oceanospirillum multiglobuliferum]|uniref:Solute-binding protein family 3/N-terminal domain-containing protein n=1 Tax=Oceanospirillum multiglobuliferum TaxID=64969 RepID=A0A1T4QVP9_9GAMM|nr:transporter substrate-binding domain-containing protein [Oceanospirillum multiglobuliferum]OPX57097.1 hypothetical protein BTE48_01330 [Oceanospirillum multiglobuliferum]SKA07803.1 polar amino acid transport system substrate-binding protein [Oceanospirillum multiglobuliferum]